MPEPSAATALALSSLLMGAAPAWAEEAAGEAADAAAAAASSGTIAPLGVTLAGWALVLSPVIFYAAFNLYRSQVGRGCAAAGQRVWRAQHVAGMSSTEVCWLVGMAGRGAEGTSTVGLLRCSAGQATLQQLALPQTKRSVRVPSGWDT